MIAEAGRDVSPFWKQRLIWRASSDVTADGHGAEGAAVIALPAGDHTKLFESAGFEMKLTSELDRSFGCFRAAGCEIDTAIFEVWRRKSKEARRKLFRRRGVELCRMREGDLRSLCSHGVGYGLNTVADADDGSLAGSIEIFLAIRSDDPGGFAAYGCRESFLEIAGEKRGHGKIVAEG